MTALWRALEAREEDAGELRPYYGYGLVSIMMDYSVVANMADVRALPQGNRPLQSIEKRQPYHSRDAAGPRPACPPTQLATTLQSLITHPHQNNNIDIS